MLSSLDCRVTAAVPVFPVCQAKMVLKVKFLDENTCIYLNNSLKAIRVWMDDLALMDGNGIGLSEIDRCTIHSF